jgi:myo-inositol-1-phosphate synthase
VAIAGVGNCASSLLQGLEYYKHHDPHDSAGLMHPLIGGYGLEHVQVVAAFDVDRRKVGRPLQEAVFAAPNCTAVFQRELPDYGVSVQMGPVLDGVAEHMQNYSEELAFRVADEEPVDVAAALREAKAEVLVCYLPVGSELAVRAYARACLAANVALVNCVPVFIASDPQFGEEFTRRGLPVIGDDIKSQFGATILHRVLARLLCDRGVRLERTYQLNTGGNTDFMNMLEGARLESKRTSKTESVQSQLDVRLPATNIHIGPSDYVPGRRTTRFASSAWSGAVSATSP